MTAHSPIHLLPTLFAAAGILAGCQIEHTPRAVHSPCPAWVNYPKDDHINEGSPYLGCTNRANLEQMLDDKQDVAAGRTLAPANGERESNAVKAYEEGKTKTPTAGSSTPGAAILIPETGRTGTQ